MKHSKKKRGFTLVELVIVIAVIAILAAVLIPTFAALIKKAHLSVDQQAVAEMNTSLEADEVLNGAPTQLESDDDSVRSVFGVLAADGFTVSSLRPMASGYGFYWISAPVNRVVLVEMDGDNPKTISYPENPINGYECACVAGDIKVTKGTEEFSDTEWFAFASTDAMVSDEIAAKSIWVYTDGFAIAEDRLSISKQPSAGYDSVTDALAGIDSDKVLIKLKAKIEESITLTKSVVLDLNGHTLDGADNNAVITVGDGSNPVTLDLFNTSSKEGMITGVSNSTNGGGVCVNAGSTFNMYSGTISGNMATCGGGIYVTGGTLNIRGGTISGNTATRDGGGIYSCNGSNVTLGSVTIDGNSATGTVTDSGRGRGGGVYSEISDLTVENATITNNTVSGKTDGSYIPGGNQNLLASGAGIFWYDTEYNSSKSKCTMHLMGGTISKNTIKGGDSYTGDSYKNGAGVACICPGGGVNRDLHPDVYLNKNCKIESNVIDSEDGNAGRGQQFYMVRVDLYTDNEDILGIEGNASVPSTHPNGCHETNGYYLSQLYRFRYNFETNTAESRSIDA